MSLPGRPAQAAGQRSVRPHNPRARRADGVEHSSDQIVCTIYSMRVHFDPEKNERNIRERGLSFEFAKDFSFESALVLVDDRREYGEARYVALGYLAERLHVLCFAEAIDGIRVISFRKANPREVARYAKVQASR